MWVAAPNIRARAALGIKLTIALQGAVTGITVTELMCTGVRQLYLDEPGITIAVICLHCITI